MITARRCVVQFARGARAGRFLRVLFNDYGQPRMAFGTTDERVATVFWSRRRAAWAVSELRRKNELSPDEGLFARSVPAQSRAVPFAESELQ